jgi:Domain of unknown function (DUF4395)
MVDPQLPRLDRAALQFNQLSIVALLMVALILNVPMIVAFVAIVMLAGTIIPSAGLFKLTYAYVVKPLKLLRPNVVEEDNTPHLFAQGLGGIFLVASYLALAVHWPVIGWSLAIIVVALATVNLTLNFCVGCVIYFQLQKAGFFVKTFTKWITEK